jgi:hypothetical protein
MVERIVCSTQPSGRNRALFRFSGAAVLALLMLLTTARAGLSSPEYHFFPTRAKGTVEKSLNGVIVAFSRGNDIGYVMVQDRSGKTHTFYLASSGRYNRKQIACFGAVGDRMGGCKFPDPNFSLGKTPVTVYYFNSFYEGKIVHVVDNIVSTT